VGHVGRSSHGLRRILRVGSGIAGISATGVGRRGWASRGFAFRAARLTARPLLTSCGVLDRLPRASEHAMSSMPVHSPLLPRRSSFWEPEVQPANDDLPDAAAASRREPSIHRCLPVLPRAQAERAERLRRAPLTLSDSVAPVEGSIARPPLRGSVWSQVWTKRWSLAGAAAVAFFTALGLGRLKAGLPAESRRAPAEVFAAARRIYAPPPISPLPEQVSANTAAGSPATPVSLATSGMTAAPAPNAELTRPRSAVARTVTPRAHKRFTPHAI